MYFENGPTAKMTNIENEQNLESYIILFARLRETFHENNSFCLQGVLKYAIKEEYQLTQHTIKTF